MTLEIETMPVANPVALNLLMLKLILIFVDRFLISWVLLIQPESLYWTKTDTPWKGSRWLGDITTGMQPALNEESNCVWKERESGRKQYDVVRSDWTETEIISGVKS